MIEWIISMHAYILGVALLAVVIYFFFNIRISMRNNRNLRELHKQIQDFETSAYLHQEHLQVQMKGLKTDMNRLKETAANEIFTSLLNKNNIAHEEEGMLYETEAALGLRRYFTSQVKRLSNVYYNFRGYLQQHRNLDILQNDSFSETVIPDVFTELPLHYNFTVHGQQYSYPDFFIKEAHKIVSQNMNEFKKFVSGMGQLNNLDEQGIFIILQKVKKQVIELHGRGVRFISRYFVTHRDEILQYEKELKQSKPKAKQYGEDIDFTNVTVSRTMLMNLFETNRYKELHDALQMIVPEHLRQILSTNASRLHDYTERKHLGLDEDTKELNKLRQSYLYIIESLGSEK